MYSKSIGWYPADGPYFQPFKEDDWANVGPGAKEGIRLIYPSAKGLREIYPKMVQLRDEQAQHFERLEIDFPFYERFTKGHLSLRSIEHSLCEFSKYWLQRKELGKQRMKFAPDMNRIVNGKRVIIDPETGDSIKYVDVG
jgi:hypothetical protein